MDDAHYNSSYRVTAAFLAYVAENYDKALVLKAEQADARWMVHRRKSSETSPARPFRNWTKSGARRSNAENLPSTRITKSNNAEQRPARLLRWPGNRNQA